MDGIRLPYVEQFVDMAPTRGLEVIRTNGTDLDGAFSIKEFRDLKVNHAVWNVRTHEEIAFASDVAARGAPSECKRRSDIRSLEKLRMIADLGRRRRVKI